jgi:alpha-glucosidase
MRLTDALVEPSRLLLHAPTAALEVQSPLPGVLRLRHAPSRQHTTALPASLPPKASWAVVAHGGRELGVRQREDGAWEVEADGARLVVRPSPLSWALLDARGATVAACERAEGEAFADYPVTRFRSRLHLRAPPGEAYLGFGEKVGTLDKRGMRLTFWNTDVVPHHPDTDPLYQSIPFFLGLSEEGRAWGLLLDETWRSEVDVAQADPERLVWESRGPELDVYLLLGPTPAEVVQRLGALTGRAPLPPLWSLGAHQSRWGYESAAEVLDVIRGYRAHRLPLDCVHLDIDHMEAYKVFTWDRSRFPDPAGLAREAAAEGVRLVPITDPAVKAEPGWRVHEEAREKDLYVRTDRGEVLLADVWPQNACYPDFTRPEAQAWWGEQHRAFVEAGMAGFWLDMNEPAAFKVHNAAQSFNVIAGTGSDLGRTEGPTLPHDARHGTRRHLEVHNVYALGMAMGAHAGVRRLAPQRRPFLLTRAGYAGIQRYAWVWTGDNSSHWTQLEQSIAMLLGLGLSGVPLCGSDVPGFIGRATGELLVRWTQLGAFYPFLRNHSGKGVAYQEPWRFGEPFLSLAREALALRYRLLPALYTLAHEASETGLPLLRPLALHAPEDREALACDDAFLLGPDVLVAPVVRPNRRHRLAYLPRGRWLALPSLREALLSGEEAGPGVQEGPAHRVAEAPLDTVPLWLRAGGALALTAPALHTTSALWEALTWVLHVSPAGDVEGRLYEDAGEGGAPGRLTRLTGRASGGGEGGEGAGLVLTRTVEGDGPAAPRTTERLLVHGLARAPREVAGAQAFRWHAAGGVLALTVPADWTRVEVRGAR